MFMGVPFEKALENLTEAVGRLLACDRSVRSVGITRHNGGYGYRAVRNIAVIEPFSRALASVREIEDVPVQFADAPGEIESLVLIVDSVPSSLAMSSLVPETHRHRRLRAGLQIQNFDDDLRQGIAGRGQITVGTLGCFVRLANDAAALLSNNHVVAGQNRGLRGVDRILQPGRRDHLPEDQIAALSEFVALQASAASASPLNGAAVMNDLDAGVAELDDAVEWTQGYLPQRGLIAPSAIARPQLGEMVFKVGRTTGLTYGEVVDVGVTVGPVIYDTGPCWFQNSITIEGVNGTMFSDKGDSGAVIVNAKGEVIGLLYAGNGQQTYACPIDLVLRQLDCRLA